MDPKTIYCRCGSACFPITEFRHENGKLIVPHIHETKRPHYVSGTPLVPEKIPGMIFIPGPGSPQSEV